MKGIDDRGDHQNADAEDEPAKRTNRDAARQSRAGMQCAWQGA